MPKDGRRRVEYAIGAKCNLGNRSRISRTVKWEKDVPRMRNPRSDKFILFRKQQGIILEDAERYYNQFHRMPADLIEAYRIVLQPGIMFSLRTDARLAHTSLQCPKGEIQTIEQDDWGGGTYAKKGSILVYVGVREATRKGRDVNNVEHMLKAEVHAFLLNGRLVVPRSLSMVIPATGDE